MGTCEFDSGLSGEQEINPKISNKMAIRLGFIRRSFLKALPSKKGAITPFRTWKYCNPISTLPCTSCHILLGIPHTQTKEPLISVQTDINKTVFFSSTFFIALITLIGSIFPDSLNQIFLEVQTWLIHNFSWIYVLAVGSVLLVAIYLMISRLGDIKLGPDHSAPDYANFSWFAMLFSAGMGIGLLFFGL